MSHHFVMENLGRGMSGKFIIGSRYRNPELDSDEKRQREIVSKRHLHMLVIEDMEINHLI